MHAIEPHYNWRNLYVASDDHNSPFFERDYSEFEFTNQVYNFLLHPQWDDFGSPTLFVKVLFADYDDGFAIIEMMGEWNDCIENDIMTLKLELIDFMLPDGIDKFILIGDNVLNFHASDDCYYEDWFDELESGWVVMLNFHEHVLEEFIQNNIDMYLVIGEDFKTIEWRTYKPKDLFEKVESIVEKRFLLE